MTGTHGTSATAFWRDRRHEPSTDRHDIIPSSEVDEAYSTRKQDRCPTAHISYSMFPMIKLAVESDVLGPVQRPPQLNESLTSQAGAAVNPNRTAAG
jgi:hypothetical protein